MKDGNWLTVGIGVILPKMPNFVVLHEPKRLQEIISTLMSRNMRRLGLLDRHNVRFRLQNFNLLSH
jgi:3-polyprenyl-4-hydroxybenzoate decarboxylase